MVRFSTWAINRDRLVAILMLLPSIILLAIFVYGFIGKTAYDSLTDWEGVAEDQEVIYYILGSDREAAAHSPHLDAFKDRNLEVLRFLDTTFESRIETVFSNVESIENHIRDADLVVGAVLIPGAKAPKLVTREMLKTMKKGAVLGALRRLGPAILLDFESGLRFSLVLLGAIRRDVVRSSRPGRIIGRGIA